MNSLPRYTYQLLFTKRECIPEIVEHVSEADARRHFALFGMDDADVYLSITLQKIDWLADEVQTLDPLEFPA